MFVTKTYNLFFIDYISVLIILLFLCSPSIMYGEAKGRFGNQLLGYSILHQLQVQLGVKSYITKETKDLLLEFFTPESVTLPVFNETFCNWRNIQKKPFTGSFQGK